MKMSFDLILSFVKKYYKQIGMFLLGLFLFYWLIFILTPSVKMSAETAVELKKIDKEIETIMEQQTVLYTEIEKYEEQLSEMDESISQINDSKNVIAGEYGEKINAAKSYDYKQLVTFLSDRYSDDRIH